MSRQPEEPIFNRIEEFRNERGMSRRELAELTGVHYQTIGYLERGEYSPSLALALRIAAVLDVDPTRLFSLKPYRRGKNSSERGKNDVSYA